MNESPPGKHPVLRRLFADRVDDDALRAMLEKVREITRLGEIYPHEGTFLRQWLEDVREAGEERAGVWPTDILLLRLSEWLIERRTDVSGPYELIDAVMDLGELEISTATEVERRLDGIPFDRPGESVVFPGKIFCFLGRYVHGSRKECQWEVNARDGVIASRPTATTDYIVLGSILRKNWGHTRMAREVQAAVNLAQNEERVHFISEQTWVSYLD